MESLPLQGTDPSCVPGESAGDTGCDGSTSTGNWGHFPAGPFPVPQNPPPFPLPCQAQLQDSWQMMEIAAMKEQSGSCQGAKALGTDSWGSSSLVHPSITAGRVPVGQAHAGWGGAGEVPVLTQLLTLHYTLPDGV